MLGAVADVGGAVGRVVETVGLAPGGHGGVASPGARGHAALLGRALTLVYHIIIIIISIIHIIIAALPAAPPPRCRRRRCTRRPGSW